MKTSNKDLSSLADTTKDATTAKLTDQIDQIDDVQNVDSEESSHPMALIIEDDISSEINVVSELKKVNFLYKTATTVKEGIDIYKSLDKQGIKIDVLFLDIVLKDKSSGIEFLKMIRANHWMENTFIIVMSSLDDEKLINECYKYKIKNFLKKPIKKKKFKIEERKIFNYLKKMRCPIEGYSIVKLLDKTQESELHLVRNDKTKKLFLLKKIGFLTNKEINQNQELLLNESNKGYCSTIVKLITSKFMNKCNYLITEYSEFGPLSKQILEKKDELIQEGYYINSEFYSNYKQVFDTEQILLWMSEIIFALYSLHEKEIVHKDLKVENIYIFNDNLVKIKNIYLVRINESIKNEFNSLIYMPPEMFSFQEYTCYTDIWNLGIILYELIMLEKPFQGINIDEIKNNIINEIYIPFPENVDLRLKRLLDLTLVFINHRASAARLLELNFIREKIDYLYKNNIIKDEELYQKISKFPIRDDNYRFSFEKKLFINRKLSENKISSTKKIIEGEPIFQIQNKKNNNFLFKVQSSPQKYYKSKSTIKIPYIIKNNNIFTQPKLKEYDYSRLFRAFIYVFFTSPKKIITHGFFSEKEELIEEYYFRDLDEESGITEEDIKNLIELKYITKVKINNQKFYSYSIFKTKNVDNSINFPEDPNYLEYISEPDTLTCKLLLKMKDVFKDFRYLIENEFATEKDKIKIISSKKFYQILTGIKLLDKINLEKISQKKKLSIILNIYQIMSFHHLIKQIIVEFSKVKNEFKSNNLFLEFQNLLSILMFNNKNNIEVIYNIGGELISLYELKHIVLRRNRIPPHKLFKLAYNSDKRINFLEGKWDDFSFDLKTKILCLCIDPYDLLDDKMNQIEQPLGICFSEKTFEKDIENSFHLFVKDNIWIDDNNSRINIPFFLKEYLFDLNNDENKMINIFLKEIYKDPFMYKEYRKMEIKMSAGKIIVRYYKEYDKPNRNV
jgi:serine/threonine protein kinase